MRAKLGVKMNTSLQSFLQRMKHQMIKRNLTLRVLIRTVTIRSLLSKRNRTAMAMIVVPKFCLRVYLRNPQKMILAAMAKAPKTKLNSPLKMTTHRRNLSRMGIMGNLQ